MSSMVLLALEVLGCCWLRTTILQIDAVGMCVNGGVVLLLGVVSAVPSACEFQAMNVRCFYPHHIITLRTRSLVPILARLARLPACRMERAVSLAAEGSTRRRRKRRRRRWRKTTLTGRRTGEQRLAGACVLFLSRFTAGRAPIFEACQESSFLTLLQVYLPRTHLHDPCSWEGKFGREENR